MVYNRDINKMDSVSHKIESLAHRPDLNILSQSFRILGSAAGIAHSMMGHGRPILSKAVEAVAEVAPVMRVPFHLLHAGAKAIQTYRATQLDQSWTASFLGGTFSAFNACRIILVESEEFLPLLESEEFVNLSGIASAIGTAIPFIKAAEMAVEIKEFICNQSIEAEIQPVDWMQLFSNITEFAVSLAVSDISPLPEKEMVMLAAGIGLGGLSIWSTLLKSSEGHHLDEHNSDILEV